MAHSAAHVRDASRGRALGDYWPLACLIAVCALAAAAIAHGASGAITMRSFMHAYMGVFLLMFATLKLFDLQGFMDGFAMYDLASRIDSRWGYVYPFVELGLGLAYLAFIAPAITYIVTIAVFLFGAAGVVLALRRGLDIACPCMGNILKVPLSTVTLTEDLGMAAMAALLLAGV
ncbi:MAG: MauE/DoxX family redox-associated membrane protein [Rhizomicrobium sp.]